PIGSILVRLGLVAESDVVELVSRQLGISVVHKEEFPFEPVQPDHFSVNFLKFHQVVPLGVRSGELELAMANPLDKYVITAVEMTCGMRVKPRIAMPSELEDAIERLYGSGRSAMDQIVADLNQPANRAESEDIEHLKDLASEAPVIRLVNLLIERAVDAGASDIHIEPFDNHLKVRYRIDGMLQEMEAPPPRMSAAVISRFKIMARLDIAERRLPQDGRIQLRSQGREIDLRLSTVPTMHGESVVIRLLRKDADALDYHQLGFSDALLSQFMGMLRQPNGILLVTGPTGSGKTTTLYSALRTLNEPTRKILTVEDPVEYELEGVNQLQVKPQIGLDFARALRALVRQDPDVIMIGEMRDLETARIAVQSAMTGHLVLSTLHTNDALSSINRLLDMGVEGYLVTSTVIGIVAQRLVRQLCPHCRERYELLPEMARELQIPMAQDGEAIKLYRAVGCEQCKGSGYRGRTAILEVLPITDELRSMVLRHAELREMNAAARASGMRPMYEDGLDKAIAGITSLEEVLRVTRVM
ncbi:MAG TPA: type II secretion system ATPase GspE, partial [Gammaproteobacteria bacterium]